MRFHLHLPHRWKPYTRVWGTLCLLVATVLAQQRPVSTCGMGYTTIDEKTFYIIGGYHYSDTESSVLYPAQFYSLDLTQSGWNTSNPPWKTLTYPATLLGTAAGLRSSYSISVPPDRRTFSLWSIVGDDKLLNYDISSDSWTQGQLPANVVMGGSGLHATADPTTGHVYIPGAGSSSWSSMMVYSFTTGLLSSGASYGTLSPGGPYNTFVWNEVRKTFILNTGNGPTSYAFLEYSPSTSQWSKLVTSGPTPPFRVRSCMVAAYNGTKMILFGGDDNATSSSANLFILDVPSMTWIEGPWAPEARSEMACSIAEDNFIVWGGFKYFPSSSQITNAGVPTTPLIYNLYTRQWTTTYVLRATPSPKPPTPSPPSSVVDPAGGGGTNAAAIGGGVAGAVVVLAAIAFFVVRRRQLCRDPHAGMKHSQASSRHNRDAVLPSMESTHRGAADLSEFSQAPPSEHHVLPDLKIVPVNKLQSAPSSPYSGHTPFQTTLPARSPAPTYASPVIPPRPTTFFNHVYPQDYIQSVGHLPNVNQEQVASRNSNPQYDPSVDRTAPIVRGPQATEDEDSSATDQELLEQINSLQAQLIRRQAKQHA